MSPCDESCRAVMDALGRHWTRHAMRRFLIRYNPDDFEPDAIVGLTDRIEAKFGEAFRNPYWDDKPYVLVTARLRRRNLSASSRVRLLYRRDQRRVITVYPLKLDPNRQFGSNLPKITL